MAGIGFEIQKLLRPRSLVGTMQAYLYAGIVSCGPWIISIFSIVILNLLLKDEISQADRNLFSSVITHAYAIALLLTGPAQFILTRHGADQLFARKRAELLPACISAMCMTALAALLVGGIVFGLLCEGSLIFKFGAISLLVFVTLIFVSTNYLGALRKFRSVVSGFAIGYLVSCMAAWYAAVHYSIAAAVFSFALGHFVLLATMLYLLTRELGASQTLANWSFLRYFTKFPELAICGLFYNFGIWGDKILFWWLARDSEVINGVLRAAPNYDIAIYLSLLSIVPGFAVFFLVLETNFAREFEEFFKVVSAGGNLDSMEKAKARVRSALHNGFGKLIAIQGFTTVLLLISSRPIGKFLSIGALQVGIFQVTLVGAFLLILFLSMLTILFYFDDRRGAMWSALAFGVGNFILTLASLLANEAWYGFGFVLAAATAVLIASARINRRFTDFEYHVFHG